MTQTTDKDDIDNMYIPWPCGIHDPYVGVACDDPRYMEAIDWANKTHNAYQAEVRSQLRSIRQAS